MTAEIHVLPTRQARRAEGPTGTQQRGRPIYPTGNQQGDVLIVEGWDMRAVLVSGHGVKVRFEMRDDAGAWRRVGVLTGPAAEAYRDTAIATDGCHDALIGLGLGAMIVCAAFENGDVVLG